MGKKKLISAGLVATALGAIITLGLKKKDKVKNGYVTIKNKVKKKGNYAN